MSKEVVVVKAAEVTAPIVKQGAEQIVPKVLDVVAKNPVALAAVVTAGVCVTCSVVAWQALKNASEITWGKFTFKGKS